MGTHIEWVHAPEAGLESFAPDDDWVGAGSQKLGEYVLAVATDDLVAIYGTPAELRAMLTRALAALPATAPPSPAATTDAGRLVAEYDAWREDRADLSARENAGSLQGIGRLWHASDDAGCDLADRLADALRPTVDPA